MRFLSPRAAMAALFVSSVAALVGGCSSQAFPPSPVNAVLNQSEAARLAELHLNATDPQSNPRDVVSFASTGNGTLVGFETFFDETHLPPKQSRLIMVENNGKTREIVFTD